MIPFSPPRSVSWPEMSYAISTAEVNSQYTTGGNEYQPLSEACPKSITPQMTPYIELDSKIEPTRDPISIIRDLLDSNPNLANELELLTKLLEAQEARSKDLLHEKESTVTRAQADLVRQEIRWSRREGSLTETVDDLKAEKEMMSQEMDAQHKKAAEDKNKYLNQVKEWEDKIKQLQDEKSNLEESLNSSNGIQSQLKDKLKAKDTQIQNSKSELKRSEELLKKERLYRVKADKSSSDEIKAVKNTSRKMMEDHDLELNKKDKEIQTLQEEAEKLRSETRAANTKATEFEHENKGLLEETSQLEAEKLLLHKEFKLQNAKERLLQHNLKSIGEDWGLNVSFKRKGDDNGRILSDGEEGQYGSDGGDGCFVKGVII